ncbi:hypothetical protein P12x_005248 [Tundrisphaera lichenicola]|uniref:hypothetical protein n=1 Tax=Tundrisphaera lichenicola TaxID=2029860 RepID=UPI003EB70D33
MQPSEFWGADTWTVMDAYDGYAMSKGVKIGNSDKLTKDDIEELNRMMEEKEMQMREGSA